MSSVLLFKTFLQPVSASVTLCQVQDGQLPGVVKLVELLLTPIVVTVIQLNIDGIGGKVAGFVAYAYIKGHSRVFVKIKGNSDEEWNE